jgi:hypothetical protein
MMTWIAAASLSLLLAPGEMARIRVGESIAGRLNPSDPPLDGHGPARRFELEAERDGPVTVSLESYDFDAFLRIETASGEKVTEGDGGGIETNARVVLDARAKMRYAITASARKGEAGEFTLVSGGGGGGIEPGHPFLWAPFIYTGLGR